MNERDILKTIGALLPEPEVLADDAWVDPAFGLIYTTDMLVAGHHFSLDYFSPADVAVKAAAVNISDVAAMGGRLQYLLVSLGLPRALANEAFVCEFYTALLQSVQGFGGKIIGGDTVGAEQLTVNITAIGRLPGGHTLGLRSGAKPGDFVIATGWHGLSATGLAVLQQNLSGYPESRQAHLRPSPRVREGLLLSSRFPRYAMMDTSDGLADALLKIADASGVCLEVQVERIPLHPEVRSLAESSGVNVLDVVLYGGEDFQLVATVPSVAGIETDFTIIGRVVEGQGAVLKDKEGQSLLLESGRTYQHFASAFSEEGLHGG